MDDLISRQAVLNEFCHSCDGWNCNPNTCCKTEWIRKIPPIQPEIIRCRECKFASGDSRICMKFGHSPIGELDFCSFAERRGVNNESN